MMSYKEYLEKTLRKYQAQEIVDRLAIKTTRKRKITNPETAVKEAF